MAQLVGRGQYTLVHLHDGKHMQLYLSSNLHTVQHYSRLTHQFSPDFSVTPIKITPELYFSGSGDNQISLILQPKWKINGQDPIHYSGVVDVENPYTLTINENLLTNVQLDIVFCCVVADPDTGLKVQISSNICIAKQETDGFTPTMLLDTPDGCLFKNEQHNELTAVCKLMIGSRNLISELKCIWYIIGKDGTPTLLQDSLLVHGQGTDTLTVASDYISTQTSFKCVIKYKEAIYTEFVTFSKQIDPYFLKIENRNGDKMVNGRGVIICEAHIYRSGVMLDDAKAEDLFTFIWRKYNKHTGQEDLSWRGAFERSITLNKDDIDTLSTFTCEITPKSNLRFPYTLPFKLL